MIVPMFDDVARMSVGRPARRRVRVVVGEEVVGHLEAVGHRRAPSSATTIPSSRAAASVMTLLTEPGSNTVVRARLLPGRAGRPALGGHLRGWPWRGSRRCAGSMTITVPPRAPIALDLVGEGLLGRVLHAAVDGEHEVVAGPGGDDVALAAAGSCGRSGSRSTTSSPGSPVSTPSYCSSSPAGPTLSTLTLPSTQRARSPAGWKRACSSRRWTPASASSSTCVGDVVGDLAGEVGELAVGGRGRPASSAAGTPEDGARAAAAASGSSTCGGRPTPSAAAATGRGRCRCGRAPSRGRRAARSTGCAASSPRASSRSPVDHLQLRQAADRRRANRTAKTTSTARSRRNGLPPCGRRRPGRGRRGVGPRGGRRRRAAAARAPSRCAGAGAGATGRRARAGGAGWRDGAHRPVEHPVRVVRIEAVPAHWFSRRLRGSGACRAYSSRLPASSVEVGRVGAAATVDRPGRASGR